MKKIMMGMVLAGMSMGGWAACSYNFDATQAQISAMAPSMNAIKMTNLSGSHVQATISSTSDTDFFVAVSSDIANKQQVIFNNGSYDLPVGDLTIPTTGVLVYEYELKAPVSLNPGEQVSLGFLFGVGTYGLSGSSGIIAAKFEQGGALLGVVGHNNGQTSDNQVYPASGTNVNRIGIYFDQTAKKWGTIINGVNKGYVGSLSHAVDNYSFRIMAAVERISTNSSSIGKSFSIELITDKNKFKYTYPSGAMDLCGNVI